MQSSTRRVALGVARPPRERERNLERARPMRVTAISAGVEGRLR
jgi:hypothetical protein